MTMGSHGLEVAKMRKPEPQGCKDQKAAARILKLEKRAQEREDADRQLQEKKTAEAEEFQRQQAKDAAKDAASGSSGGGRRSFGTA